MENTVDELFAGADWGVLMPRLVHYADGLMCSLKWRGAQIAQGTGTTPSGNSFSAEDAANHAISLILDGKRNYQNSVGLEQNLRGVIRSIISNWNKSSNRQPLIEIYPKYEDTDGFVDPIQNAADPGLSLANDVGAAEYLAHQAMALDAFKISLGTEPQLVALMQAYIDEVYTPKEIEAITQIPASRVYELKRKLYLRMKNFIAAHPDMAAVLERIPHAKSTI